MKTITNLYLTFATLIALIVMGCAQPEDTISAKGKIERPAGGTEIGNGAGGQTLAYNNINLGISLRYSQDWSIEQSNEGSGVVRVTFKNKSTSESVTLRMQKNPAKSGADYLGHLNKRDQKVYTPITLGALNGLILSEQPAKVVLANDAVVIYADSALLNSIKALLAQINYTDPECARYAKGEWIRYKRSLVQKNINDFITVIVNDVDLAKNEVTLRVETSGSVEQKTLACRGADDWLKSAGFQQAQDFKYERVDIQIDVNVVVRVRNADKKIIEEPTKTVVIKEELKSNGANHHLRNLKGQNEIIRTYFADYAPVTGIVLQQVMDRQGDVVEEWKIFDYGRANQVRQDVRSDAVVFRLDRADEVVLESVQVVPAAEKLQMANRFMKESKPHLAWEVYNMLLADQRQMNDLGVAGLSSAYFGRAFSALIRFTEGAEYQDLLQRMGFDPYFGSTKFFGPIGFLSVYSSVDTKRFCEDQKENGPTDKARKHLLPFGGSECNEGERTAMEILERTPLYSFLYQGRLEPLIRDFAAIQSDIEMALKDPNFEYDVPAGLHHGTRSYTFYSLEAKALLASIHTTKAVSEYALAYDTINWPVGDLFLRQTAEEKNIDNRKNERLFRVFAKEFNRAFLHLKPGQMARLERAKSEMERTLSLTAEVLTMSQDLNLKSNYIRHEAVDRSVKILREYNEDFMKSLQTGETIIRNLKNQPRINFKQGLEKPFDSENKELPLAVVVIQEPVWIWDEKTQNQREEIVWNFKANAEFFKKWGETFTPDANTPKWEGKWMKDLTAKDFDRYQRQYGPLDLAKKEIITKNKE